MSHGRIRSRSNSWDPLEFGERPALPSEDWDPNASRLGHSDFPPPTGAYQSEPQNTYAGRRGAKPSFGVQSSQAYEPVNDPDDDGIELISRGQKVPTQAYTVGDIWQPGLWTHAPGWGLGALFGCLICMA